LKRTKIVVWSPWATMGLGAVILFIWLMIQMLVMVVIAAMSLYENPDQDFVGLVTRQSTNSMALGACLILSCSAGVGLIWTGIQLKKGAIPKDYLELKPISMRTLAAVLGITFAFCVSTDLLAFFLGKPIVTNEMMKIYTGGSNNFLLWVGAVIFESFFMEFFFRGFLFEGLRHSRLGVVGTALLTSGCYTLVFLPYDYWLLFCTMFSMGLLSVAFRVKTGSLWSCVASAVLVNLIAMVEMFMVAHGYLPK
jgi:membrane protease YdiL (CAAX protease family)